MPNQLMHIVARAQEDDRIKVRVIPFRAGEHAGLSGPFTLLDFEGGLPDILYLDAGRGAIELISNDDQAVEYRDNFEKLLETALSAEDSLEFIHAAAEEMS